MFNAYTEEREGQMTNDFFSPGTIQADSGGLQMVTLGHKPTPELRKKVYEVQAKYSNIGMSFDEIPVKTIGNRSSKLDMDTRVFDMTLLKDAAKQSALNIIEQVETFDRLNSKCKPYIIIQGNCYETYQEWTDIMMRTIPSDHLDKCYGIASGAAALGQGTLEDIERYFTLSQLNAPKHLLKNFHILGVGSPNRIVLLARLQHLFHKDVKISYDSSKHTGGIMRGQVQMGANLSSIGRNRNPKYFEIWNAFNEFQGTHLGTKFTETEFFEAMMLLASEVYAIRGQANENPEYFSKFNLVRFCIVAFSVYNMFTLIDGVKKGHMPKTKHDEAILHSLSHITSISEFNEWKRNHGRFVRSNRVQTTDDISEGLEGFFA